MTEKKIQVGPVCCYSLSIVIERENCSVWERNSPKALSPTVVTVLVLVYIVPEMNYVVDGVLASYKPNVSMD